MSATSAGAPPRRSDGADAPRLEPVAGPAPPGLGDQARRAASAGASAAAAGADGRQGDRQPRAGRGSARPARRRRGASEPAGGRRDEQRQDAPRRRHARPPGRAPAAGARSARAALDLGVAEIRSWRSTSAGSIGRSPGRSKHDGGLGRAARAATSASAAGAKLPVHATIATTFTAHAGRHRLRHPRQPAGLRGRARGRRAAPSADASCGAWATSSATAPTPTPASSSPRGHAAICLAGNHDLAVRGELPLDGVLARRGARGASGRRR